MSYDAMRVLLRLAMMKRALLDIYLETMADMPPEQQRRGQRTHRTHIMSGTSQAYAVVMQLYDYVDEWRRAHAEHITMPAPSAPLDVEVLAAFIDKISASADLDAYSLGDFPETISPRHPILPKRLMADIDDDDMDTYDDGDAFDVDDDDYVPELLFADEHSATPEDHAATMNDDAPDQTDFTSHDAYDVYLGWVIESTHRDGLPNRSDFACADMQWHQPDKTLPQLSDSECKSLFGLRVVPPTPGMPRITYDIFGNIIDAPTPSADTDDDPDYNIPT